MKDPLEKALELLESSARFLLLEAKHLREAKGKERPALARALHPLAEEAATLANRVYGLEKLIHKDEDNSAEALRREFF
jgi:hypothetical protein